MKFFISFLFLHLHSSIVDFLFVELSSYILQPTGAPHCTEKKISAFFNNSRVFKMLKLLLSILQGLNADNPDVSWSINFLPTPCHFLKHMSCVDRGQHLAYSVKISCLERREVVSTLRFLISQNSPVVIPLKMNEMPDALAFIPAIFISQSCNFFKVSRL